MALTADEQKLIDDYTASGLARWVLMERECKRMRQAVLALTNAQRDALSTLGGGHVWAAMQNIRDVLAAPSPPTAVVVPRGAWLRRERMAEALQVLVRDDTLTRETVRAALQEAGGVVGEVELSPLNEADAL